MKKRILSIILALTMTLCLLSVSALAAEPGFGISMGGTQLEAGKYYRADADGNAEETTAENYEIYFIENDTNVYTLTINDAAEHEITFGSHTNLTVVDYTTAPGGNRATHVARDGGAVMIQSRDGDVTGEPENASLLPTFIVMTSGTTDSTLAPGQTMTVAYLDDDGGYTNACPIQAAETNTDDVALLLRGDRGLSNAVVLGNGVALTMEGILYEFTPDVNNPSLTMDFHMNLDSPISEYSHTSGSLKISAPDDYTGIFNGYDFAEGCTEAEFRISKGENHHSVNTLIRGAIALDEGESVTVNGVPVEGAGSTVITMNADTGDATVDGSAIIDGTLETRGNPGDDDYRALVEIDEHSTVTLQEGDAESLETTYFSLANGGTVTVPAETSIAYSSLGNYLELREGIITASGMEDTVITSYTNYSGEMIATGNIEFSTQDTDSFTLENNWDSVTLSYLSGDMHIAMDEGTELHYSASNAAKVIKAQSRIDNLTIREDGSIWAGETIAQPDADGNYVVGAEHETVALGGFTIFGNPDGASYDDETGILTVETRGSYTIQNTASGTTGDAISVDAPGTVLTLKDIRIETAATAALTVCAEEVTIYAEGSNTLTGIDTSGIANYNSSPLPICGNGTLTVTGNAFLAVEGSLYISGPAVTVTGADGIWGDVFMDSGELTVTGTTHAGIRGDVDLYGGTLAVTGGSGGNGDDGEPAIDGDVSLYDGTLTVTGGKAVAGSNGNGGAGVTGSVYVLDGTATLTGGAGSGTGSNGNGISDEANLSGNTDRVAVAEGKPESAPVVIRYKVTADAENGTIDVGARFQRGDVVTFTVTPDAGYVLKGLTVIRRNGAEVSVTENSGVYTFTMPASAVTVKAEFAPVFEDITPDHQFYEAIKWVWQNKLMNGVTETTFDRVNPVTRQQVWRILARILTGEDPGSMAAAKEWAMAQGITDGTTPGAAATREEFVTMLWTAYGKPAADTSALTAFSDASAISADATAAMAWAVEQEIVGGYEDGTLRPAASTSRGAFAAILFRYLAK